MNILKSYKYILNGLDCANCAKKIEDKIASTEGYKNVNVNFSTLKLSFKTDKTSNVKEEISEIVHSLEPDIKLQEQVIEETQRNNTDIIRLVLGITLFLIGMYLNIGKIEYHIITISALIILIAKTAKKAFIQITKNKTLDENALIVISAIGAYIVGKQTEGAMVIFLYEIGKILEARAVNKTRKSIANLMNIKPEYANLKNGEDIIKTNPEKVKIGEGKIVEINGQKIGLYKDKDGQVYKVNPICKHLGCELTWNNLEKTWDCPCHGSRYDYKGNLIYGPSVKGLDK